MAKNILERIHQRCKGMEQTFRERGWERSGSDIKDYLVPDRGKFLQGNTPSTTNEANIDNRQYIIDDTGEEKLGFLVSGFMSMLVPETSVWFKAATNDPAIKDIQRVRVWFDNVTDLILRVFSNADVYGTLYNTFTEFCSFATGFQLLDSDEVLTIRPKSYTFGEAFIELGPDKMPDTFAHKSYWSAKELVDEFGEDSVSQVVKEQMKPNGQAEKRFLVWHYIEPRGKTKGLDNPNGMAFNSVYFEEENVSKGIALRTSGYHEFPVQAPRWLAISNDTYGKESPGMKQLANIKMLQSQTEDYLIISKRMGDPPLVSSGNYNDINSLPGGITNSPDITGSQPSVQPLFSQPGNPAVLREGMQDTRDLIDVGFYNPLFLIVSNTSDAKRMTATEVVSRNEEKFAMLGPILNRVFNELLKPMINRTFNILERQGFFSEDGEFPVPPELAGQDFDIEFVSVLAQAQRAVGMANIDRFVERIGTLAAISPEALDRVDFDEMVNVWGKNIPASILKDQETTDNERAARAEQQQAMAEMAAMESAAETVNKLGNTPAGGDTALAEMAEE